VKARLAEAISAAASGERVVITKHGKPVVEMGPVRKKGGFDFAKAAEVRERLGLTGVKITLPDNFDDPAFSRQVLGLED
jgi:antitoxin (DNA-binding transcriptional repressor) of toxin-antitoxin stability system